MTRATSDQFEYDVALSFASDNKALADELTRLLTGKDIQVFQDEYKADSHWGKNVVDHLVNLYARKARYCVLFLSQYYPLQKWTEEERRAAQEAAFRDAKEYILPLRVDNMEESGVTGTSGDLDLSERTMEHIAELLEQKLASTKSRSGPPPQSHDLRSGNVPSTR